MLVLTTCFYEHQIYSISFVTSNFVYLTFNFVYNVDFKFRYHAAMCAISGLNPQRFRGFGPSDPRLYTYLQESRFRTRQNKHQSDETIVTASRELAAKYGSESYLNAPCRSISDPLFASLQKYYDTTATSVRHEVSMSAQMAGRIRLAEILNTQRERKRYSGPSQQGGKQRKRKKRGDEDEWTAADK